MANSSSVRSRNRSGGNWSAGAGVGPPQAQYMRGAHMGAVPGPMGLPLSTPPVQPHLIQGNYNNQQQQRRPLLSQPVMGIPHPSQAPPTRSQMMRFSPAGAPTIYMAPQQHGIPGMPFQPQYPQQIFSSNPTGYPVASVRQQQQHTGQRPYTSYDQKKPRAKAIAIVDPDTKVELDVNNLSKSTADTASTTAVSQAELKKKEFKDQVHGFAGGSTSVTISDPVPPNALISNPDTAGTTANVSPVVVESTDKIKSQVKVDSTDLVDPSQTGPPLTVPVSQPVAPPASQPAPLSVSQPSSQPMSQPVSQPVSQDTPQSISQSITTVTTTNIQPVVTLTDSSVGTATAPLTEPVKSIVATPPVDLSSTETAESKRSTPASTQDVDRQLQADNLEPPSVSPSPPEDSQDSEPVPIPEPSSAAGDELDTESTSATLGDNLSSTILQPSKHDSSESSVTSNDSQSLDISSKPSADMKEDDRKETDEEEDLKQELSQEDDEITSDEIPIETETGSSEEVEENPEIVNGHDKEDIGILKDEHGRFIYEREFLLRYSSLSLPPPMILLQSDIFSPGGGLRLDGLKRTNQSASSRHGAKKVIEHNPTRSEKVELRKADKRWTRPQERADDNDPGTTELFRKFQGILNKLTPQKFKNLAESARDLDINTEERLKGCIDKIFSKALEEPNFSVAYAHLCRVLSFIKVEVVKVDENGDETVKETTFRRELLTRCQKEFEKDKKDDEIREEKLKRIEEADTEEKKKLQEAELKEWEDRTRSRSLGNIRFIGELFKLKMLSESIMHECIVRLLRSTSDEDALECFSRLITTTGKELDHPQAKVRLDRYFERIDEIIEKKKISSRIRFMLQDVQEMRKNDWVSRRQETLKTIDQIHQEAQMEAMQEKEMIRAMQPTVSGKQYARDDKKRGSKGQDDYGSGRKTEKGSGRRDSTPDVSRIQALGSTRKEKTTPILGPGPSLRPGGWNKRSQAPTPPPPSSTTPPMEPKVDKDKSSKGPQRSSSSGKRQLPSSGKGSQQGARRSVTNPESEKSDVLKSIKDFYHQPPPPPQIVKKPVDKLTEEVVERKTCTIVDELSQNNDFKEAVECTLEMESPGLLHVFVRVAINHSLEKSSQVRAVVGKLFDQLVREKHLPEEKLSQGFQEVLEFADDLEVDIPRIWDFLSELVTPAVLGGSLSLALYAKLLNEAKLEKKVAKNIARTLKCCQRQLVSKEKVFQIWEGSGLKWTDIGLSEGDVKDFLQDEELTFLVQSPSVAPATSDSPPYDPPYLKDLSSLFRSQNSTNDDIITWIEKQIVKEEYRTASFIKTLARATVSGSTTGEGSSTIFNDDNFSKRLPLLKKWVDEEQELQEVVLDGVQVGVALLKHPPDLLRKMFSLLYDVEVVSERALLNWKEKGKEKFGRGVALQSTKKFFQWLASAETESDTETDP